jgi:hypothetical protein
MLNKRGQELSTNTIILIILGVIVLVLLILGFVMGWNKVLPFLNKPNIDSVNQGCLQACTTLSTYDFCTVLRNVNDGTNKEFKTTCKDLATNQSYASRNYGISDCSDVTCPPIVETPAATPASA